MNNLLLLSFDLIRAGEVNKSFAISSIITYLKNDRRYGEAFEVEHLSIDMFGLNNKTRPEDLKVYFESLNLQKFNFIALSAYIWNEFLTNNLMAYLRTNFGFEGDFILGGYQISYSNTPEKEYPAAKYFISGYAEASLLQLLTEKEPYITRWSSTVEFTQIPSPYLNKELEIAPHQKMVRMETKRGCPYRCTFCAHRDLTYNKVHKHSLEKVFAEIAFFKEQKVQKINLVDPIFNAGNEYLKVLKEFTRTNTSSLISVQTRFETITGEKGDLFLDYCEQLNINLEFGLQTAIQEESNLINRKNNPNKIKAVLSKLNERGIDYEISLIYGLPTQTLESFKQSVEFTLKHGCTNLTAFPLMLLKGTELYQSKDKYGFVEEEIGEYNIPIVTKSNSFTEKDWLTMQDIASNLSPNGRI